MLFRSILGTTDFTSLYDKGYHTGSEFKIANDLNIDVMVAIPKTPKTSQAPDPLYNAENFIYNQEEDYYICPQNHKLKTTGKEHIAKTYKFKRYTTKSCMLCYIKEKCSKARYGKAIQRSEYQEYIINNKERIEENRDYYRKRQAIVEHPYGTIKRQWGFGYIITKKGKERASSDVGLMFIAYNLKRIINILGKEVFSDYLNKLSLHNFNIFVHIRLILNRYAEFIFLRYFFKLNFDYCLNRLIFGQNLNKNGGF